MHLFPHSFCSKVIPLLLLLGISCLSFVSASPAFNHRNARAENTGIITSLLRQLDQCYTTRSRIRRSITGIHSRISGLEARLSVLGRKAFDSRAGLSELERIVAEYHRKNNEATEHVRALLELSLEERTVSANCSDLRSTLTLVTGETSYSVYPRATNERSERPRINTRRRPSSVGPDVESNLNQIESNILAEVRPRVERQVSRNEVPGGSGNEVSQVRTNTEVLDESNAINLCAICLDPLSSARAHETTCGHIFHYNCLSAWLRNGFRANCPMCRRNLRRIR